MAKKLEKYTLDQVKGKYIGEVGTSKRDQYEIDLRLELIGEMIKRARKERKLTQAELGDMIGVQKAQISKLENNAKNVSIATILKVFKAMKTTVKLKIEFQEFDIETT